MSWQRVGQPTSLTMNLAGLAALALRVDLAEGEIENVAERCADQVLRLERLWRDAGTPEPDAMRALRAVALQHRVAMPGVDTFNQRLNRMRDPAWWRRALRKRLRIVELHAIANGAVHAHASPYVSAKALRRFDRDRRRLADLLASLDATNTSTGEVLPLEDVIASSQANPANRRMAMMARIKGIEAHAKSKGHEALFVTLTAPSRMHARHRTGQANERHDGTGPRAAHAYLHRVWRRAMRELQRRGLKAYGMRTVEPHHDACPHWHVLVFVPPDDAEAVLAALRRHALADTPDEQGAAEHRLKVERIDPAKGSALPYVAKYVSKSIDGEGVDADDETGRDGVDTSRRIVAWARRWGIRQFQFFGLPPITPMRELYRHDGEGLGSEALSEAHEACKANDHAAYLQALEGHDIRFAVRYDKRQSTRYPDEMTLVIRGLNACAVDLKEPRQLITRTEIWVIQPRQKSADMADASACVLSLGLDSITARVQTNQRLTPTPLEALDAAANGPTKAGRRRRPPPAAGPRSAAV